MLLYTNRAVLSRYYGKFWSDAPALLLSLWVIVPFLGIYFLVLLFYRKRQLSRRLVSVLLCVLVFSEAGFQARSFLTPATALGRGLCAGDRPVRPHRPGHALPREGRKISTLTRIFWAGLGYATVGHYTSLTDAGYMHALQALGYSTTWMEIRSSGGTLLSDRAAFAAVQRHHTPTRTTARDVVYENGTYQIVRQPYALPYGFFAKGLGESLSLSGDRLRAAAGRRPRAVRGDRGRSLNASSPQPSRAGRSRPRRTAAFRSRRASG